MKYYRCIIIVGAFFTVLHRVAAIDDDDLDLITLKPQITPVIPWDGKKLYGESDCDSWTVLAGKQLSAINPDQKKRDIEPKACKLSYGLECLKESEASSKHTCGCFVSLGSRPVALKVGEDEHTECFIPAGQGWASECFQNGIPPDINFPLPYGDALGSGPDPPLQIDQINADTGGDTKIFYLPWNTIQLRCVPNSECREGSAYIGRRCQCLKDSIFNRTGGTCSNVHKFQTTSLISSVIIQIQLQLYYWFFG